jgi:hypothetical protein
MKVIRLRDYTESAVITNLEIISISIAFNMDNKLFFSPKYPKRHWGPSVFLFHGSAGDPSL